MVRGRLQETAVSLLVLAGLAATTHGSPASKPRVVYEKALPDGLDRCLLIVRSNFVLPRLEKQCSNFLASRPRLKFSRLFIATTIDLAALARSAKGAFDYGYGEWMARIDAESQKRGGAAELIQIADSAVLRVAWDSGQVQEIVLRGTNFLHQRVEGVNVDLKWLFTSKAHLTGQTSLNVFLGTTNPLSEKAAVAIAAHFDKKLGIRPVWYDVRTDPWFVDDDFYPWVNPFYPITSKPSREEYMKTYSYLCKPESDSGRISCSRFGPRVP